MGRSLRIMNEECSKLTFYKIEEDAPGVQTTNIFIAAFITCCARLRLYQHLDTWTTWGVMRFIWTQIQLCGGLVSHRSLKAIFWGEMTDELYPADGSRDCIV